ncbi:MAG TPA: ABC-2 family transporter protein, partial [Alphaproteobacteria bacterium]|nr:ABC-2 family transporter protein [Alphaproteobacteria bacterium]
VKPVNALFRVLLGGPDPIDLITIPPIIFVVVWIGSTLNPDMLHTIYYVLLVINGLLIAAAFHIAVLAFGIITLEVDHLIMVYRDLSSMGRFPIDIYKQPLKGILTFIVPIGIMVTLPAKALAGLVSPLGIILSILIGVFVFFVSLKFWNFAVTKYTSASS